MAKEDENKKKDEESKENKQELEEILDEQESVNKQELELDKRESFDLSEILLKEIIEDEIVDKLDDLKNEKTSKKMNSIFYEDGKDNNYSNNNEKTNYDNRSFSFRDKKDVNINDTFTIDEEKFVNNKLLYNESNEQENDEQGVFKKYRFDDTFYKSNFV